MEPGPLSLKRINAGARDTSANNPMAMRGIAALFPLVSFKFISPAQCKAPPQKENAGHYARSKPD